jgi:ApeA N-terminal domain 1
VRYLGSFVLPHGQTLVGELTITGSQTTVTIHSDDVVPELSARAVITGRAYSGEALTLIDCISYAANTILGPDGSTRRHQHSAYVNHVVIGSRHVDPDTMTICRIEFSCTDLNSIFYDRSAFGIVAESHNLIDAVLESTRKSNPVESGEDALVAYYSGKSPVITVQTVLGAITVEHRPSYGSGAHKGIHIKDHLTLCVVPSVPIRFDEVLEHVHDLVTFLSTASGRCQGVRRVRISSNDAGVGSMPEMLDLRSSFRWRRRGKGGHIQAVLEGSPLGRC